MAREDEGPYEDSRDLERDIDPRVDDSAELILAITKPVVDKKYHKYVSRDLAVGNIPNLEIVAVVRKYVSIMSDFLFLKLPEMADVYNADLKGYLSALRSLKGFERKQQTTITHARTGGIEAGKKSRWGLKK